MEEASTSSSSEDRLVRCPKCGNLLPELPDFSVCLCDDCGAVLRAKRKVLVEDGLSGISDDEKGRAVLNVCEADERGISGFEANRTLDLDNCSTSRTESDHKYVDSNVRNKLKEIQHSVESISSSTVIEKRGPHGTAMDRRGTNFAPLKERSPEYGSGDYRRHYDGFNGFARVADLENDRAELLRRIDELKDQLSRTCDVAESHKERIAVEPRMASMPCDPYRQGLFGANKQPLDQGLGPPYILEDGGNVPYQVRGGSVLQDSYPATHYRHGMVHNEYPAYQPYQYFPQTYHNEYPNTNSHPLRLHPHKSPFHQPACSCSQCFNHNRTAIPPPAFGKQRSHDPVDPILYQRKISAARGFVPPNQDWLRSSSGHSLASFDLGHQTPPRKVIAAHGNGEVCRAMSGGAPFITCCHCFELLKLPLKLRTMGKNQNRMRCGACSSIMLYQLSGKGIVLSVPKQIAKFSAEVADNLDDTSNKSFESSHGCMNPCSNYGIADTKDESFPGNEKSNSDESEKSHDAHSLPSKDDVSLPLSDSPLRNYTSSDDAAEKYIKVTKESNEKEGQQNSVKDASVATEMDISMNSVNSGVSLEFSEASKDNDRLNDQEGSEDRSSYVFVNGQLIRPNDVKRAEKFAGPIQLGKYWYDVRAGFWGVIGHPCLGIIPPNIEELNYPMPKNCAAGNTGVFVNGRELHQKDLDLLANRGLPTTKNKSYLVEISGKVVNEQTGEELNSLGKLAPTVERVKHGFGMKIPKFIAEQ